MSLNQNRRSSIINIDEWLDRCSNDEPDSMIYDPDYANEVAAIRAKQKSSELESLYKVVTDICTKIGLPTETLDDRLSDIDECLITFFNTIQKDVQDEYDKLCLYKEGLLNNVQKMTNDLYLPPYVPDDNITLLQHCKRLKTEFNKLNTVREKRMSKLKELRERQTQLCIVLGIKSPEQIKMQTDIPTEEELAKFAIVIADLEMEERRRKEKYRVLKETIKKCADLLEINNPLVYDEQDLSESNLVKMAELHSKLEAQYAKNQTKFDHLMNRLVSLYNRLDITGPERDMFLDSHSSCKPSIMAEIELKIDEYEELKKQNIGKFIEKIMFELEIEYERCYLPRDQLESFFSLSSEASEELLALYEGELERLKKYHEDNCKILEKFGEWQNMWGALTNLEKQSPSRLNNRGGRLLVEARLRKDLQRNLPKIEKELMDLNATYTSKNGEKFKVFGTNLDDYIAGKKEELNRDKEQQKRQRQITKMTPTKKNTTTTLKVAAMRQTPIKRAPVAVSRLHGAVSLNEQQFEDLALARPTSAKRKAAGKFDR